LLRPFPRFRSGQVGARNDVPHKGAADKPRSSGN